MDSIYLYVEDGKKVTGTIFSGGSPFRVTEHGTINGARPVKGFVGTISNCARKEEPWWSTPE